MQKRLDIKSSLFFKEKYIVNIFILAHKFPILTHTNRINDERRRFGCLWIR